MNDVSSVVRIAIAIPSGEFVNVHFMLSLLNLRSRDNSYKIVTFINSASCRIAYNRNNLAALALKSPHNPTHLLFIDTDMIFPAWAVDELVHHNVDIVGATAAKRDTDHDAIGVTLNGERLKVPSPLVKMSMLGLPFTLIKLDVFKKLQAPWFAEPPRNLINEPSNCEELLPEDEYFCYIANKAGYDVYCDINLSMHIGHRGGKTFMIGDPTRE